MSYLTYISTALPKYKHLQEDFVNFYTNSVDDEDSQIIRKIRIVGARCGIKQRHSVLKDFSSDSDKFDFFPRSSKLIPSVGLNRRMEIYKVEAIKLSVEAVNKIPNFGAIRNKITHVITVTCTGLYAPGLDIELIELLGLNPKTKRSSINFMGCNAAILAMKQANDICNSNLNANVLIVCTELCTLHFQKNYSDDYIISNSLFADGSAAVIISGNYDVIDDDFKVLEIQEFNSLIAHEGSVDMAWQVTETGFVMNLTSYVSAIINKHMPQLLTAIASHEISKWLIHPGGIKILDECQKTLGISKNELMESYQTLENNGNMSSPTILFVIKDYLENLTNTNLENICALGFGPGLSIESVTFSHV